MSEIIDELKAILGASPAQHFVLRLYVIGHSPGSARAIANIKSICDARLTGRYELEVIDLYQQRDLASGRQVVVAPTLVKELPLPVRRLVGDLSDTPKVLLTLGLKPAFVAETATDAKSAT